MRPRSDIEPYGKYKDSNFSGSRRVNDSCCAKFVGFCVVTHSETLCGRFISVISAASHEARCVVRKDIEDRHVSTSPHRVPCIRVTQVGKRRRIIRGNGGITRFPFCWLSMVDGFSFFSPVFPAHHRNSQPLGSLFVPAPETKAKQEIFEKQLSQQRKLIVLGVKEKKLMMIYVFPGLNSGSASFPTEPYDNALGSCYLGHLINR